LKGKEVFNEDIFLEIISTNAIANINAYIEDIKDSAIKRDVASLSTKIQEELTNKDLPSSEILDFLQQKLYNITSQAHSKEFKDAKTAVEATLEHIKAMKEIGNEGITGVDTGYKELNKITTGFNAGDLVIVAARPAMGKTSLVLNFAQKALDKNIGVAFYSLEMPAEQLLIRMFSAKTSIPLQKLKVGDMVDNEWTRLSTAMDEMSGKKFFIDDNGLADINHVRSSLRKLKSENPEVGLAVIDYLQLMVSKSSQDRHLQVSEISRGLKLLARELDMPIIALSQLNRSLESRSDKRPMLSDLRESGAIEQDADMILFVYRDDVYRIREEKEKEQKARAEGKEYKSTFSEKMEEEAEVIVGKNRNGPIGIANLTFQKQFTRFVNKGIPVQITFEDQKETKIEGMVEI
jgi:replicative DNA helicase